MGRVVAIGEGEVLDGLQLCGVQLRSLRAANEAELALPSSQDDIDVLIVTPAVASVLRERLKGRRPLHVVVPE